jgi:predicted TIM-barrel enzyme
MIRLDKALRAWGTPDFEAVLKQEIAQLGADQLPLQQGLLTGNYVTADPITVAINSVAETGNVIRVKAGIFYRSVIGGCSCEGDPTPTGENNEYCEVQLDIDKSSAETAVAPGY